jgi:hypothetical protein
MPEKPDLWKSKEFYAEEKIRTIKLYHIKHWDFEFSTPNTSKYGFKTRRTSRKLKHDIQKWLQDRNFPHKMVLGGNGRSRIIFEQKDHAMLFKLTWS